MNQLTQTPPTVAIRRKFHIGTGRTGHRVVRDTAPPAPAPVHSSAGHIPRLSRLMALALRFEQLIREGTVHNQANLARLAHISRARVTQSMDLLLLAPEIQEEILFLPPVEKGKGSDHGEAHASDDQIIIMAVAEGHLVRCDEVFPLIMSVQRKRRKKCNGYG